ncbi:hypothetical protein G6F42_027534 [Rhizopus arrhizus]|nr:hypothetical protein G6F42_027534 [Rhizopus arrhizus]
MRFRLLLLSVLLISVESKHIKTKVVILGAGASGISAARALSNAGMEDYVIVDAQSFIGGRVQHEAFGNSFVELGANWVSERSNLTVTDAYSVTDLWQRRQSNSQNGHATWAKDNTQ